MPDLNLASSVLVCVILKVLDRKHKRPIYKSVSLITWPLGYCNFILFARTQSAAFTQEALQTLQDFLLIGLLHVSLRLYSFE